MGTDQVNVSHGKFERDGVMRLGFRLGIHNDVNGNERYETFEYADHDAAGIAQYEDINSAANDGKVDFKDELDMLTDQEVGGNGKTWFESLSLLNQGKLFGYCGRAHANNECP